MSVPARRATSGSSEDRRAGAGERRAGDRRSGDRRRGQAAVLHHRRATDRRLDLPGLSLRLQRQAFEQRVAPRPVPVEHVELLPEPVADLVRCPLCEVLHDRLWLFAHVARDHRTAS